MKTKYDEIWSRALKILETRLHSNKELMDKLLLKFPQEEELILKVIKEMERLNLMSDRQFTEEYLTHLTQKNIGRLRIMNEGRKKGLSLNQMEQALLDQEWSEEKAAQKALKEKEGSLGGLDKRKKKQKLMAFLRSRGFNDRVIYKILSHEL